MGSTESDTGVRSTAPRVSIIVPVFNTEDYLESCLRSVLAQTEPALEVVIVDDGSTDRSAEICRRFAAIDQRVRLASQGNSGQGVARNLGLDMARGDFVLFVDSDDTVAPELCEAALAQIGDADFLSFRLDFLDEAGASRSPVSPYSVERMEGLQIFQAAMLDRDVLTSPCNKLYRRATIEANKVRFPPLRAWEDSYFSREMARVSRLAVFDNTVRYHALMRSGSTSRALDPRKLADAVALFEHERRAFAKELQDQETALLFEAHVLKFLTHLLVLAALRTKSREDYLQCFAVAESYGYQDRRRARAVLARLPAKIRVVAALAANPDLLQLGVKVAARLGMRPY